MSEKPWQRNEAYEDLRAALEWGSKLELTPEQRVSLRQLCFSIAGDHMIPAFRLAESQEKKRAAEARAEAAEKRVTELEAALKARRDEWVFRRVQRSDNPKTHG